MESAEFLDALPALRARGLGQESGGVGKVES